MTKCWWWMTMMVLLLLKLHAILLLLEELNDTLPSLVSTPQWQRSALTV